MDILILPLFTSSAPLKESIIFKKKVFRNLGLCKIKKLLKIITILYYLRMDNKKIDGSIIFAQHAKIILFFTICSQLYHHWTNSSAFARRLSPPFNVGWIVWQDFILGDTAVSWMTYPQPPCKSNKIKSIVHKNHCYTSLPAFLKQ